MLGLRLALPFCCQVSELKRQLEQNKQADSSTLSELCGDIDVDDPLLTQRATARTTVDNKQKEKLKQMDQKRREAHEVGIVGDMELHLGNVLMT